MKNTFLLLVALFGANTIFAQRDSVVVLEEVVLTDSKLRHFSNGIKLTRISDSVLQRNTGMLTDNLRFTTPIYFKENGYGMVASAAFRGTSAQQTAVVWNGININSQLNGQTDFNTLMPQNYEAIQIRSGGGSTQYGSGAVGGSIHLNNTLTFNSPLKNKLHLGYGSFNTRKLFYKAATGTKNFALNLGLGHLASTNDYDYLGTDQKNENGAFANNAFDLGLGFTLSKTSILKVYHHTFLGNRDFSGTLTAPSNDSYSDFNSRTLTEWVPGKSNRIQRIRAAYLFERFRFYPDSAREEFSFGKAGNVQAEYDIKYALKNVTLNGLLIANTIVADGTSIIADRRNQLGVVALLSHKVSEKLGYGFTARKDWVSDYSSPFVFSFDGNYQLSKAYSFRINASRNYRVPTFNDLYWQGSGAIGNTNLQPENAWQVEMGHAFDGKWYGIDLAGFYSTTSNFIQWLPNSSGIWSPANLKEVSQLGVEVDFRLEKRIYQHHIVWRNSYAFTQALDTETKFQLLYVPKHKFTSNVAYNYHKWGAFVQGLYNGDVFTTTDNSAKLNPYLVIDLGLEYQLPNVYGVATKTILSVHNLTNTAYQNVAFRPMPNRNVSINLNFNF